jgi:DNA-directed RNA polymerase subunit RPC12/RpoP
MSRPSYRIVDNVERNAFISSRNDVLNKSFAADLWMKVINRAIDDLVIYTIYELEGKELKEEEKEYKESAYGFLFDENYTIALDDYEAIVRCQKCGQETPRRMSIVTSEDFVCPKCRNKITAKTAAGNVVNFSSRVETTLEELLSYWGMDNVEAFRTGCEKRIKELVSRRRHDR